MIREREYGAVSGWAALVVLLVAAGFCLWQLILAIDAHRDPLVITYVIGFGFTAFLLTGLFVVNPNEARVLQLFGNYVGTTKAPGLRWAAGRLFQLCSARRASQSRQTAPGECTHRNLPLAVMPWMRPLAPVK